jgi:hypothetical protein
MAASITFCAETPFSGAKGPVMSLMIPTVSDLPDADPVADPLGADELEPDEDGAEPVDAELGEVLPLDDDFDDELHAAAPRSRIAAVTAPNTVLVVVDLLTKYPPRDVGPHGPWALTIRNRS